MHRENGKGSFFCPLPYSLIIFAMAIAFFVPGIASAAEVTLAWDANTEPDLAGYKIYRRTSPNDDWVLVITVDSSTTTYTDSNLNPDTQYYYTITAYDNAPTPNESPHSSESSVTTQPESKPESETEDGFPMVPILLSIIIINIVFFLILLLKRKSKEEKLPAEVAAPGYGIEDKEKPSEAKEGEKNG